MFCHSERSEEPAFPRPHLRIERLFVTPRPFPDRFSAVVIPTFLLCHSERSEESALPAPIPTIPVLNSSVKVIRHILSLRKTSRFCGNLPAAKGPQVVTWKSGP